MAKAPKMVNLSIEETSGVDHPAHLHEGWLVMKAADMTDLAPVLDALATPTDEEVPMSDGVEVTAVDEDEVVATDELAAAQARIAELEAAVASMESAAPSEEEVLKAAPEAVIKMVTALREEKASAVAKAVAAETALASERESRQNEAAVKKAEAWTNLSIDPAVVGPALRQIEDSNPSLAKSIEDALTAANAQAESGAIFQEIGKAAPSMEGSAVERMTAMAKAAVSEGKFKTVEQAVADIAVANPEMYASYVSESKGA
jgi:hypothetical protein